MIKKFNIFTGLLKAYDSPDGKSFRTTASSTITDLAGDEILAPAIEKMAEKANGNLTIFLNHEYRVPEDVLGSVTKTSMQTRGADADGNPIVDLDFDIRLNESNPRALQTFEAIKSGVRLGTSIGAIVRHAEKKKGGGLRIDDIDLLEASIVGIPANPRSWVHYAMKSLDIEEIPVEDEAVIDEEKVAEAEPEEAKAVDGDQAKDAEPEVTEAEPDKEAARTRVTVTVDSEAAQDAPKSQPETALLDETADGDDAALGDTVTAAVEPDLTAEAGLSSEDTADLATVVKRFSEIVSEYTDLKKSYEKAVAEGAELKENLDVAMQIINRIADLPVGRQTQFKGAVSDFRTRFPQYDNEFIKFLEK